MPSELSSASKPFLLSLPSLFVLRLSATSVGRPRLLATSVGRPLLPPPPFPRAFGSPLLWWIRERTWRGPSLSLLLPLSPDRTEQNMMRFGRGRREPSSFFASLFSDGGIRERDGFRLNTMCFDRLGLLSLPSFLKTVPVRTDPAKSSRALTLACS